MDLVEDADKKGVLVEVPHQLKPSVKKTTRGDIFNRANSGEFNRWSYYGYSSDHILELNQGPEVVREDKPELWELCQDHDEIVEVIRSGETEYYSVPDRPDPIAWAIHAIGHDLNHCRLFESVEEAIESYEDRSHTKTHRKGKVLKLLKNL